MTFDCPKAFEPMATEKVTVFSVKQTPGRVAREESLFSCRCMITEGAEISNGGPSAKSQTGKLYQAVIPAAAWKGEFPPVAGTTKLESQTYGTLLCNAVSRLGDDWILSCISKGVRQ